MVMTDINDCYSNISCLLGVVECKIIDNARFELTIFKISGEGIRHLTLSQWEIRVRPSNKKTKQKKHQSHLY